MTQEAEIRVAAVDIGTNSVRVLIASTDGRGGLRTHHRQQWLTRLGQGVDESGRLHPDAIARTVEAVGLAAEAWRGHGAQRVRITATSAARDASNAEQFVAAVLAIADVVPEVIPGDAEADLAFLGAASGLGGLGLADPLVVVDIGGGSTELIVGDAATGAVVSATSLQLGSVRLTEQHLHDDPPTPAQVDAAADAASAALRAGAATVLGGRPAGTVVAVAGTATTLGAVAQRLPSYDAAALHGLRLSADRVAQVAERLLGMAAVDIAADPAVEAGREDVIGAGALVLRTALDVLGADEVVICTTDVLDGIALDLLRRPAER